MKRTTSKTAWLVAPVVLTVSVIGLGEVVEGKPSRGRATGLLRRGVGRGRRSGLHCGRAVAGGGAHDLWLRGRRGVRRGDGGGGRLRAVRRRRRRPRRRLRRSGGGGGRPPDPRPPSPGQAALIIEPAYAASLNTIADGQAKTDGIAAGDAVASQLIDLRSDDGFRAPASYTPPNPPIPGVWLPTAPTPPIGPYLGLMDPFSLPSADQFRPDGPPPLDSKRWADDYNEVKEIGSATSATRTGDQTLAARFWGEAPVQQARGSFRRFVLDHQLDVVEAARFNAMWSVTYADALIACFDAKYTYTLWRPITAIRAGETDGNDATLGDPAWTPLLPTTPNHPEYPQRPLVHHPRRRTSRRQVPRHAIDRLHRPQPRHPRRSPLRHRQGSRVRGEQRTHLGRHPLPLSRRRRRQDRHTRRQLGARPPLPPITGLGPVRERGATDRRSAFASPISPPAAETVTQTR